MQKMEEANNLRRYLAEFIGTFFLVWVGTGAIMINEITGGVIGNLGIAFAFGLIVMIMIYTIGDLSGAHMNPAVTIAFFTQKEIDIKDTTLYVISQLTGAMMACYANKFILGEGIANQGATLPSGSIMQSFVLEIILTALLMFVILGVTSGSKEKRNLAGIIIGGVIFMEAGFAGPICGASMNPARSIAPAIVSGNMFALWAYIVGPVVGAILGGILFNTILLGQSNIQLN